MNRLVVVWVMYYRMLFLAQHFKYCVYVGKFGPFGELCELFNELIGIYNRILNFFSKHKILKNIYY